MRPHCGPITKTVTMSHALAPVVTMPRPRLLSWTCYLITIGKKRSQKESTCHRITRAASSRSCRGPRGWTPRIVRQRCGLESIFSHVTLNFGRTQVMVFRFTVRTEYSVVLEDPQCPTCLPPQSSADKGDSGCRPIRSIAMPLTEV